MFHQIGLEVLFYLELITSVRLVGIVGSKNLLRSLNQHELHYVCSRHSCFRIIDTFCKRFILPKRIAHSYQPITNRLAAVFLRMASQAARFWAAAGEDVFQITLDRHKLRLRWGRAGDELRSQNLRFNSTDEARTEYLSRLENLAAKGYLDATAG